MNGLGKIKFTLVITGFALVNINGCSREEGDIKQKLEVEVMDEAIEEQLRPILDVAAENKDSLDKDEIEEDFQVFFKAYFSFTEDELMILNEQRDLTEADYWEQLESDYGKLLEEKIGGYLQEDLREKIQFEYRKEDIFLPNWMLINDYMVSGQAEVEKVEITSVRQNEGEWIYIIKVITLNLCYPIDEFIKEYSWNNQVKCFVKEEEAELMDDGVLQNIYDTVGRPCSYLYSESLDAVRLQQNFRITVNKDKGFKISRIEAASPLTAGSDNQRPFLNTQHVLRLPYDEQIGDQEMNLLESVTAALFEKDRQTYSYYEKAYHAGEMMFNKLWEEWGMSDKIVLPAGEYEMAFPEDISPYKGQIKSIKVNKSKINIQNSVYSTKNQPRFILTVPVEALLYNNQIVYYSYKYFVGIEEDKVEFIQFMSMKEIKEF